MNDETPSAREVAATVLERVASGAAYASLALDAELSRAKLDRRDASLATEIVYGALRVLPDIDVVISRVLSRPDTKLDPLVQATLRSATYQLLYLDRVPAHAIVDTAVTLLSRKRGKKLAGFANALLRRIAREYVGQHPRVPMVVPGWLQQALDAGVGSERARLVVSRRTTPALSLRVNTERISREACIERLRAHPDIIVRASVLSPLGVQVEGAGDPRKLPGHDDGWFVVQEEGAQVATLACGVRSGEQVLDACAGHGGKTTYFAQAVGAPGHVTAFDLHERKLDRLLKETARLGLPPDRVDTLPVDLTVGDGGETRLFDRVIVDAPCTGTGTLMRRPELMLRLGPEDPARMAALQRAIVERAASLLKPNGVLVYIVCSLTRDEGPGVIDAIDARVLSRCAPDVSLPIATDDDGVLRIGAWCGDEKESAPDGYQLAWFRRASGA